VKKAYELLKDLSSLKAMKVFYHKIILKWLAIAYEVRTAIAYSDKIIYIPELSF